MIDLIVGICRKMREQRTRTGIVFSTKAKIIITSVVAMCVILCLSIVYIKQRTPRFSERRLTLNSSQIYQEVDVPFRLQQGLIHVRAKFAGQNADCIIDTGCASILCPQNFLSEGTPTWCHATVRDDSGRTVQVRQIVVKDVKLGGYELHDMPVFQLDENGKKQNKTKPTSASIAYPLLGNSAFAHVVLTIDYHRKLLIIRQHQYDFDQSHISINDKVLRFCWGDVLPNGCGVIEVAGKIHSIPLHFIFDTGYTGNMLGLSDLAVKTKLTKAGLLSSNNFKVLEAGFGSMRGGYVKNVTWSLQNNAYISSYTINRTTPAILIKNLGLASDAIMGPSLFQDYCITIDYPRKKILLASHWYHQPLLAGQQSPCQAQQSPTTK